MKEKDGEEKFPIDNYLCVNTCHSCYNNLIREENKYTEKKTMKPKKT